jgi:hypothetical protein
MYRRSQIALISIAAVMGILALVVAAWLDRGLADPEGFLGPAWIRLPAMLLGALLVDLLPRTLWKSRFRPAGMPEVVRDRIRSHWTRERLTLVFAGLICFYVTYVSYRNLKSFLPAVRGVDNTNRFDRDLHLLDRTLFFGHEPGVVLHNVLGAGVSAQFLSAIYLWFLPLVPIALAGWLVWARDLAHGYWFVVSQCIAWSLGTASYYALPTLGPGFEYAFLYKDLEGTPSGQLMEALISGRHGVNLGILSDEVQSVAGFASLHCAITMLFAMMAQVSVRSRVVHWVLWANFGITIVATIYFGWHYIADDVAGIAIALVAFYWGGLAAGLRFDREPAIAALPETSRAVPARQ